MDGRVGLKCDAGFLVCGVILERGIGDLRLAS
jgi:hypothetical protein